MTVEHSKEDTAYSVVGRIVYKLSQTLDTSSGKAMLANLRNSIGRPISHTMSIWPLIFEDMPGSFLGKNGTLTYEERAIITTLQLFALHQQGKTESMVLAGENERAKNIGYSLSFLRMEDSSLSTDRRFNAMITSGTFEELEHHLRQMIKLLKAKTSAKINYPKLAEDLFWFQRGYEENIRLSWARAYYSTNVKGEEKDEQK